ncbi:hypothetical protein PR048_007860 [Dryococelus australis]|uniref:Uncharacterized protein n=1 Tax=Dryococelus australis TaxID=614101 RepID=A0ABQ9HWC8_9NEOP|nr:hypothetical protein PR048_007860 [Dryococelus australis]
MPHTRRLLARRLPILVIGVGGRIGTICVHIMRNQCKTTAAAGKHMAGVGRLDVSHPCSTKIYQTPQQLFTSQITGTPNGFIRIDVHVNNHRWRALTDSAALHNFVRPDFIKENTVKSVYKTVHLATHQHSCEIAGKVDRSHMRH